MVVGFTYEDTFEMDSGTVQVFWSGKDYIAQFIFVAVSCIIKPDAQGTSRTDKKGIAGVVVEQPRQPYTATM